MKQMTLNDIDKNINLKINNNDIDISIELQLLKSFKTTIIRPKHIANIFNVDDKLIRRHLRKNFAHMHDHKSNWIFNIDDELLHNIIKYFKKLYK